MPGIAHGGQILVSEKLWDAARSELDMLTLYYEYMGEHYLKGLKSSEKIVMILPRSLESVIIIEILCILFCEVEKKSISNPYNK
jgi:class 3 adenylate cyclase